MTSKALPAWLVAALLLAACTARGPLAASNSPSSSPQSTATPTAAGSPSPSAPASPSQSPATSPSPTTSPSPAAPGTWQRMTQMTVPRADFAMITLFSNKVLLIGGETSDSSDTAAVDIFDPKTNTISAAAPLSTPRNGHTAVLLPDGKVLVAGGTSSPQGPALASTEVYDSATNTWKAAASMAEARSHAAFALTPIGKVFIAGGDGGFGGPTPTGYEVYDETTNTWTSVQASFGSRSNGPTATGLRDGRIMVAFGLTQVAPGGSVELYDPNIGQTSFARSLGPPDRSYSTSAGFGDGTVIFMGGQQTYNPTGALNTTDIYNPATDIWTIGPVMNVGHCHHTMTRLAPETLLVAGGRCGGSESIAVAEIYNAITKRWTLAAPMLDALGFHAASGLSDTRVVVAGGILQGGAISANVEIYTPP